jgi:hypothetical protein
LAFDFRQVEYKNGRFRRIWMVSNGAVKGFGWSDMYLWVHNTKESKKIPLGYTYNTNPLNWN